MSLAEPVIDHAAAPVWAPFVSLGVDVASPWAAAKQGAGVWDRSHWNSPTDARWSGLEPSWSSVVCDVVAAKIARGRSGALERVGTSTATLGVVNDTGWASWSDNPDPAVSLGLRPGRAVRMTAELADGTASTLWSGWLQSVNETYPAAGEGPPRADLAAVDSLSRLALVDPLEVDPPIGAGETIDARLRRLCALAGWPTSAQNFEPSPVTVQATALSRNLLDEAQLVVETEGGILYGDRDGSIRSRSRDWLRVEPFATAVQATFSNTGEGWCPAGIVVDGPDVSTVQNRIIVGRENGVAMQFDDLDSQSLYGIRTFKRLDYVADHDSQVELVGSRRLLLAAQPARRLQQLIVKPLSDPDNLFPFVLAVDYGWRLHVEYVHPRNGWGWSGDVHVHAIDHAIDAGGWVTTLRVEDASPWVAGSGWDRDLWGQGKWNGTVAADEVTTARRANQGGLQRWA